MKNGIRILTVLSAVLWAGASCKRHADEKVLHLYTWSEYFPKPVLDEFTQKTGIKVIAATYSTNEELMDKLASGVSDYDVVVPSDYAVRILVLDKRLLPIDRSKVPNFTHLDPRQLALSFDKENRYSLPLFWGTTGLGVNREKIKEPVDSWAAVFDPKNSRNISMLKDARENFVVALKMMGKSINETDPTVLKQAADLLSRQTKLVKIYDSDSFDVNLRSGEAALVQGFNGQIAKVVAENRAKFYYVVPKEGATHWVDNLAIPASTKRAEAAHAFLNFIHDPEVNARMVKTVGYASANETAKKFIPAEILNDSSIYPSDEVLKRCEVMDDIGPAATLVDKLWTQIKAQ
jgi:spermidine/putrescine-binding protein